MSAGDDADESPRSGGESAEGDADSSVGSDEESTGTGAAFRGQWRVDYGDYDPAAVEAALESEWRRDLLLADYENAAEDGRNKETLLIQSFYVSLALFGLLLDVASRLYWNDRLAELAGVAAVGALLFCLLSNWSLRYRRGRNAAWDRRSEIEDYVERVDDALLRSNDAKFKRLTRVENGRYRLDGQRWYETGSIADLVVYTELGIGALWVVVATYAVATLA